MQHFLERIDESRLPEQMKAALRARGHLMQPAGEAIAYAVAMRDLHCAAFRGSDKHLAPACMAVVANVPIEQARAELIEQRAKQDESIVICTAITEPPAGSDWKRYR